MYRAACTHNFRSPHCGSISCKWRHLQHNPNLDCRVTGCALEPCSQWLSPTLGLVRIFGISSKRPAWPDSSPVPSAW